MTYSQSVRLLCNYLHAQIIGSRCVLQISKNRLHGLFDHGGFRSMSSLQRTFKTQLPACSLSFPSWSFVIQWEMILKHVRFYSKGKGDKSKYFFLVLFSLQVNVQYKNCRKKRFSYYK